MIASLSSEWLKLRTTRTIFWVLVALTAVVTLLAIASVAATHKENISSAHDQLDLLGIGSLSLLIALIMGLIVSTGEFRHGTITPTLLATPSRATVATSKAIAGILFGVTLVALAEGLVACEVAIALPVKGVDFAIQAGPAAGLIGRTLLAAALWGAIGSSVGLAIRNQIGAVVSCFAWLFIAEGLINAILRIHAINSHAGRFLPLTATSAVLNTGTRNSADLLSHGAGMAALTGWMLLATIAALLLLQRRDVS